LCPKYFYPSACACLAVLLAFSWSDAQAASPAQVVFDGSIKPVAVAPATGPINANKPFISRTTLKASESSAMMTIEVALKMRNFAELQGRVNKGERVSFAEMAAKYEPMPSDYQAVTEWLTSKGLTITRRDGHHLAVFARGTVGQVAQAMQVNFARVTKEGKEYTSAVTAPSVPASIAPLLMGINGLQPHIRAHKHIIIPNAANGAAPYTPSQIAQAYQASGLYTSNITGAGQSIAIVIDTFPSTADLISFWKTYGVNQSINNIQFIQTIQASSGALDPPSGEETLDTEWSSSIAPGAKVRVYAATDLANADLDSAYAQVLADTTAHPELGIHQMSMSYGGGEIETTDNQMQTDDQYFLELTNAGVTCFASSGDAGSVPATDASNNPELEPESPASDPNVIGVGGTTLKLNSSNNETSEVVWNDGSSGGASGGGTSTYFARPSWQTGTGVTSGTKRLVPDIACAADPDFGADTILAGTAETSGGTSWASPTCAAFCALINQARANAGLAPIGSMGPLIYPLIGTGNFRDITIGNNALPGSGGLYSATTGYDEATGIGVPLVQTLAKTLAKTQNLTGVTQQPEVQSVVPGQNATFTVSASGSPVGYQWQRMPAGTTSWSNLSDNGVYSGSSTATLTVTGATTAMSGDQFQCVVTYTGTGALTSVPSSTLIVEIPWKISTLAGTAGVSGLTTNASGTAAQFNYPTGIAIDSSGVLYVSDLQNNEIRKVSPSGAVTTPYGSLAGTAGSTNASGVSSLFSSPRDIAIDSSNNLYVADEGNNSIRKINTSSGSVGTYGASASPAFNDPKGVAVDSAGNVFVADYGNNTIRKIATNGTVTTVAGQTGVAGYMDGPGTLALFDGPIGIAVDSADNLYVTEYYNEVIRKITSGGVVSTLAGQTCVKGTVANVGLAGVAGYQDGPGSQALFNVPRGIKVDSSGNLYVVDSYAPNTQPPPEFSGNNVLRKITPGGVVSTLAGDAGIAGSTDANGSAAQFYNPCGVAMNSSGVIYIADASNDTIRAAVEDADVTLSATQASAQVAGAVAGQFTVTRTGSTSASLAVNYSLLGSAVNGTDYSTLSGSVTIPAGASSVIVAVKPLYDSQATTNLTVQMTLTSSVAGVVINPTPATVTIVEPTLLGFTAWEASFPALVTTGATATPLNDGVPNLLKYLFDINPTVPMTAAERAEMPDVGMTTIAGTDYLTLTYRQNLVETGLAIVPQMSFDLQTWTTAPNPTQVGFDPATNDPIMQVQVPITAAMEFLRLNVTQ